MIRSVRSSRMHRYSIWVLRRLWRPSIFKRIEALKEMGGRLESRNRVWLRLSSQGAQLKAIECIHESTSFGLDSFYLRVNLFRRFKHIVIQVFVQKS